MNLDELTPQPSAQQLSQQLQRFQGWHLPVHQLSESAVIQLQRRVHETLMEFRNSTKMFVSEQNPHYLSLLMLNQTLVHRLDEIALAKTARNAVRGAANSLRNLDWKKTGKQALSAQSDLANAFLPFASQRQPTGLTDYQADTSDHHTVTQSDRADSLAYLDFFPLKRLAKFLQDLPDQEKAKISLKVYSSRDLKLLNSLVDKLKTFPINQFNRREKQIIHQIIQMFKSNPRFKQALQMESLTRHGQRAIMEGATAQAEVILAARDLVDRVQDMVETLGKMTNEELPALVETLRDTLDVTAADAFETPAQAAIDELLAATKSTRDRLDNATRELAGEPVANSDQMPAVDQEPSTAEPPLETEPTSKPRSGRKSLGRAKR